MGYEEVSLYIYYFVTGQIMVVQNIGQFMTLILPHTPSITFLHHTQFHHETLVSRKHINRCLYMEMVTVLGPLCTVLR